MDNVGFTIMSTFSPRKFIAAVMPARPGILLRPVHHAFHQTREIFIPAGLERHAPAEDIRVRFCRKLELRIFALTLPDEFDHAAIGHFHSAAAARSRLGDGGIGHRHPTGGGFKI